MSAVYRLQPLTRYWIWASIAVVIMLMAAAAWYLTGYSALLIYSEPAGAYVMLNGAVEGRTPLALTGLAAGRYRLSLIHSGHADYSQVVQLERGSVMQVDVVLSPGHGCAYVETLPSGASIYAGEHYLGQSPLKVCDLPSGRFAWLVCREGYASAVVEGSVWAGATCRLRVVLKAGESGRVSVFGEEMNAALSPVQLVGGGMLPGHLPVGAWELTVQLQDETWVSTTVPVRGYQRAVGRDSDLSTWEIGRGWMLRSFALPAATQPGGWGETGDLLVAGEAGTYWLEVPTFDPRATKVIRAWGGQLPGITKTSQGLQGPGWELDGEAWVWGGWREGAGLAYQPEGLWVIHPLTGRTQPLRVGDRQLLGAARGAVVARDAAGLWALTTNYQWRQVDLDGDWQWVGAGDSGVVLWRPGRLLLVDAQAQLTELGEPEGVVLGASLSRGQIAYVVEQDEQWLLNIAGQWQRAWPVGQRPPQLSWAPGGELLLFSPGDERIWLWERW